MDSQTTEFKPPYMSFQTYWNYLSELTSNPLPPKLDRSIMTTKSGTDQANILAALQAFDLVEEDGTVKPDLLAFKEADPEQRKQILRTLVEVFYAAPLEVSANNGTPNNLKDSFRDTYDIQGETQRKAITFFLHAARESGIELSPNFPKTRAGSGAPGIAKKKPPPRRKADKSPPPNNIPPNASGSGETVVIDLGGSGKVVVTVDVKWLQLDDDTFTSLRAAIKDLKALAADNPPADDPADEDEEVES